MKTAVIIFLVVFFVVSGGVLAYLVAVQQKKLDDLREKGQRVIAKITKINSQYHAEHIAGTSGDRHMFQLVAEWTDPQTGQTRTFESNFLTSTRNYRIGEGVPVLIDRTNPERYMMDL